MSEKILERKTIDDVSYCKGETTSEGETWIFEEWRKGFVLVSLSDNKFSLVVARVHFGDVTLKQLADLRSVADVVLQDSRHQPQ